MKALITILLTSLITNLSYGQRTEFAVFVNSGLFSFGGPSAGKSSYFYVSDIGNLPSYTDNPYGRRSGTSYGFGFQIQRVTQKNLLFGLQTGYESLSSKIKLDRAEGEIAYKLDEGKTILTNNFAYLYPYLGNRVKLSDKINTDVKLGLGMGLGLSSKERVNIMTTDGRDLRYEFDRNKQTYDLGPRLEIANYYHRAGLSVSYYYGMVNYSNHVTEERYEPKARYIRVGFSYLIN